MLQRREVLQVLARDLLFFVHFSLHLIVRRRHGLRQQLLLKLQLATLQFFPVDFLHDSFFLIFFTKDLLARFPFLAPLHDIRFLIHWVDVFEHRRSRNQIGRIFLRRTLLSDLIGLMDFGDVRPVLLENVYVSFLLAL